MTRRLWASKRLILLLALLFGGAADAYVIPQSFLDSIRHNECLVKELPTISFALQYRNKEKAVLLR